MKIIEKKDVRISQSGIATQLVINCHGGWIESDGYTHVPAGTTLMFYAKHGDFTLGYKVVEAVKEKPHEAKVGLKKVISQSRMDEIRDTHTSAADLKKSEYSVAFGIPVASLDGLMNTDPAQFDAKLKVLVDAHNATAPPNKKIPPYVSLQVLNVRKTVQEAIETEKKNTCGLYDAFGGKTLIFDYALSPETDAGRKVACDSLWDKHRKSQDYDPDVDLLQIKSKTKKSHHLSDVFKLIDGMGYKHVHFGACRVRYDGTPTDVVST